MQIVKKIIEAIFGKPKNSGSVDEAIEDISSISNSVLTEFVYDMDTGLPLENPEDYIWETRINCSPFTEQNYGPHKNHIKINGVKYQIERRTSTTTLGECGEMVKEVTIKVVDHIMQANVYIVISYSQTEIDTWEFERLEKWN